MAEMVRFTYIAPLEEPDMELALPALTLINNEVWDRPSTDVEDVEEYTKNLHLVVAHTEQGEVVSAGTLKADVNGQAKVIELATAPEYRMEGHGEAVLEKLEDTARNLGCSTIHLVTLSSAKRFYTHRGYEVSGSDVHLSKAL
jgi:N-acetylglutamate synthase-like GNAT family acetyltransferase